MQDIEFTVQEGKLYILQTRSGKRTAAAAVRIAVEMVREGLIDRDTALLARSSRADARTRSAPRIEPTRDSPRTVDRTGAH